MKRALVRIIGAYKRWLSPGMPAACRYTPTCSEYAMEAIERHGSMAGGALAIGRLLRCHPFVEGGLDPVPEQTIFKRHKRLHSYGRHS